MPRRPRRTRKQSQPAPYQPPLPNELDPSNIWGARAGEHLHWFHQDQQAWLSHSAAASSSSWAGWSHPSATPHSLSVWQPWSAVFDASEAPFVRWFCGAHTNAAFNELDRQILPGGSRSSRRGSSSSQAFLFEAADSSPSALTLQQLLLQSSLAASALRDQLAVCAPSRLAIYMPNHPQVRFRKASR